MTTVQVLLADRSYPIRIRPGSLSEVGEALLKELAARRVVVITTPRVAVAHYGAVATSLARVQLYPHRIDVPEGDRAKTLRVASRLYDELIEIGADRETLLLGLGGGAVGDLTGFVASTFLRGLPLVQIPTTLLAQVDASVGGKTGVNHARGKNLIGTFYQPRLVWIDPDVLATLPPRERRCGLAEVVKVAVIWDAKFFAWLEENVEAVLELEREALSYAISRACGIKAEIVGLDEREAGLRALLNFGHTLGHAIESVAGYRRVRHGEAVAAGMVFAARLSERFGLARDGVAERLSDLLKRIGLPTEPPDWGEERETYLRAIVVDKKMKREKVGFVVLRDVGRAGVFPVAPEEIIKQGRARA
ncbi:MAG: 3-dehydroquinate synthase [Deltaproteobacteria bacterium]|nr:3-dehydroquinate synthase [Deltaproteobacteria bacterium]